MVEEQTVQTKVWEENGVASNLIFYLWLRLKIATNFCYFDPFLKYDMYDNS